MNTTIEIDELALTLSAEEIMTLLLKWLKSDYSMHNFDKRMPDYTQILKESTDFIDKLEKLREHHHYCRLKYFFNDIVKYYNYKEIERKNNFK